MKMLQLMNYNFKLLKMGTSCVGKANKHQPKKTDSKSNTVSSEVQSIDEIVLHPSKQIKLPLITLSHYQHNQHPMPADFKIFMDQLRIEKEYRYLDLLDFRKDKFISSRTISDFSQQKMEQHNAETGWSQCSNLQRQLFSNSSIFVVNGNTYVKMEDLASKHKAQQVNETEIELYLADEVQPKQILLLNIEKGQESTMKTKQRRFDIVQNQDIQIIVREILERHSQFQYFYTPFLNGIAFTQKEQVKQTTEPHFLQTMFMLKRQLSQSTVLLLYANKRTKKKMPPLHPLKGKLSKYFEIDNFVKQMYGDVWHCKIGFLDLFVEKDKQDGYLAIQFFKCIVDSMERQQLSSGKYVQKRESLIQKRQKLIHQFLILEKGALRSLQFLLNVFLALQGFKDDIQIIKAIKAVEKSIACDLAMICDGLFHEFGYQINEKQHYFKLQSYYFVKYKTQRKSIRHLYKNIQIPQHELVNKIKASLFEVCSYERINEDLLQLVRQNFMKDVERYMNSKINILLIDDFLLRLKVLKLYLSIAKQRDVQVEWKSLQDHMNLIEFVSLEAMLFYFTIGALISSALKLNSERTQAEEYFYLKSLEMSHKMYGDPRANRAQMPIEKQQVWELLILENYSSHFTGAFEKKEYHYLNNIAQCLKEDFKYMHQLPQLTSIESPSLKLVRMIDYVPIKTISGVFYRRSLVLDSENQDIRSNYSQSLSSSSSKRINKTSYKISQSQFSIKLSLFSGVIRWGQNIAGLPHILPPLKNKQVISISSGNYHTVFLTETGIYGWGQNGSSQLGSHNKEKIYLKEIICIKEITINRNKDRYQISCGNEHTAVLINDILHMWGQTQGGILAGNGHIFDYISCGGLHTLAIREGIVFSWGRGEGGQLGHSLVMLKQKKKEETTQYFIDVPLAIKSIPALSIKVACGDAHSLVLTTDGKVYVFGFCYQGQLGLGLTGQNQNFQIFEPQQQNFFKERIIDIFAGPTFSFFKTQKQQVFSCGINDCLQLGIDRVLKVFQKKKYLNRTVELNRKKIGEQQFSKPRKIDMFSSQVDLNLAHLECGQNHCLAVVKYMGQQEMVMGWGLNKHFQIDSQLSETTTPRTLDSLYSLQVLQICCGSTFSLANIGKVMMTDGQLQHFLKECDQGGKQI